MYPSSLPKRILRKSSKLKVACICFCGVLIADAGEGIAVARGRQSCWSTKLKENEVHSAFTHS